MFSAIRCLGFEVLAAGVLNQDFQDFEDYRGRLCFELEGYM